MIEESEFSMLHPTFSFGYLTVLQKLKNTSECVCNVNISLSSFFQNIEIFNASPYYAQPSVVLKQEYSNEINYF